MSKNCILMRFFNELVIKKIKIMSIIDHEIRWKPFFNVFYGALKYLSLFQILKVNLFWFIITSFCLT